MLKYFNQITRIALKDGVIPPALLMTYAINHGK
jgi:hypothetical protein